MLRNLLFEDADVSYCKHDAGPEGQTYTFRGDDLGISIIDYIFILRNVTKVYTRADYHNHRSNHVMIFGEYSYRANQPLVEPRRVKSWKLYKLREEEYRERMQSNFKDVHVPSLNVLSDYLTDTPSQVNKIAIG